MARARSEAPGAARDAARGRLSRRALLGASAGGLAGLAASRLGGGVAQAAEAGSAKRDPDRPNALVIMLDRVRADYIGAYGGSAHTPNIDALARQSLRFEIALPEGLPALPARNALITAARTFPFRNWQVTKGLPAIPGWNPIYDYQPTLFELLDAGGVKASYITNNPMLSDDRFSDYVISTERLPSAGGDERLERGYLMPLQERRTPTKPQCDCETEDCGCPPGPPQGGAARRARREPTATVMRRALRELDSLKRNQPFFLGVDAFDPYELYEPPRAYVNKRLAPEIDDPFDSGFAFEPTDDRTVAAELIQVNASQATVDEVRARYAAELRAADRWVGRILNKLDDDGLADSTAVLLLSDGAMALGEQGIFGLPVDVSNRDVFRVPYMIRDPGGRRAGDESKFFPSTHDAGTTLLAMMGISRAGAMNGEDLSPLFADMEVPPRYHFTTGMAQTMLVANKRWLLLSDNELQQQRLFATPHKDDPGRIIERTAERPDTLSEMYATAIETVGGTFPAFDERRAVRPRQQRERHREWRKV